MNSDEYDYHYIPYDGDDEQAAEAITKTNIDNSYRVEPLRDKMREENTSDKLRQRAIDGLTKSNGRVP
jgi:hypothetical protein